MLCLLLLSQYLIKKTRVRSNEIRDDNLSNLVVYDEIKVDKKYIFKY